MSNDNDPISELMSREGLSYPEAVERLVGKILGATGRYPKGAHEPGDEGELRAALSISGDKVRIDFGPKPVAWLVLDPDAALAIAAAMIDKAMHLKMIDERGDRR
jgi:hypothetical protein